MTENQIAKEIVESSLKIHRTLGPGLLESVYESCLQFELIAKGMTVVKQHPLPVVYQGIRFEQGFRLDLLVQNKVVVEVKSVEELNPVHMAQVLTYLKLGDYKLGLLINFNVELIKHGIRRLVNGL